MLAPKIAPILAALFCLTASETAHAQRPASRSVPRIDVCFTPQDDCIARILERIEESQQSILVLARLISSAPIAQELLEAKQRGVSVRIILDLSTIELHHSQGDFLASAGIEVFLDGEHEVLSTAIMIFDESAILTGSLDYDRLPRSETVHDLLLIDDAPALTRKYLANWVTHRRHSTLMKRSKAPTEQSDLRVVYVTPSGKKYHQRDCPHARDTGKPVSLEQAHEAGRTPCRVCRPDDTDSESTRRQSRKMR